MTNCSKCGFDFTLKKTEGNTKTYECNCPRSIVETAQLNPIETRIKALETKMDALTKP